MPRPVVIATDPGLDDAVAIPFALSRPGAFDLRAVTKVAGNLGLATITRNAGRLLAVMGRSDVPVIAGADRPPARPGIDETRLHGADGLGSVPLPEPLVPAQTGAVAALAARLMAGLVGTLNLMLVPLDATRRVHAVRPDLTRMAAGGPAARLGAALIEAYFDLTRNIARQAQSRPLHDPCMVLLAERPDLFRIQTRALAVDRGAETGAPISGPHRVQVALQADGAAALAALMCGLA